MMKTHKNTRSVDLRKRFDVMVKVDGGTLYRRGAINQVWWGGNIRETWTAPSVEQAIENFTSMSERWAN